MPACRSVLFAVVILCGPVLQAADKSVGPDAQELTKSRARAIEFLKTTQADDGSWTSASQPGITALVVAALIESGVSADDAAVSKALKHLEGYIRQDGGIYTPESKHRNYESSIALLAFKAANTDGKYDETITNAVSFLKGLQWDEGEGKEPSDPYYGGAGYGGSSRPDLSNTQFFLDALRAASVPTSDPAVQKALAFVSRCQNLESEHNTLPSGAMINDGGFFYTCAAGGNSPAGTEPNGGLRSYGAMTYAGLKSMIHAGLAPDDPRVKAATAWIRKYYTLDENPGMAQSGLYYYYHTFAKALSVMGASEFEDAEGVKHDWRKELAGHLLERQQENGSWVNGTDRWYEGDPNLVTAYALLALAYCDGTK
jgi:squalene-hopene/tetraprenyl-beta-curcumene cyclase